MNIKHTVGLKNSICSKVRYSYITTILLAFILLFISICIKQPVSAYSLKTYTTSDKKAKITLSQEWKKESKIANTSTFEAFTNDAKKGLIIRHDSKKKYIGMTLDEMTTKYNNNFKSIDSKLIISATKKIKIKNLPATQTELNVNNKGHRIIYLSTIIETKNYYAQVLVYSFKESYNSKLKIQFENLINSYTTTEKQNIIFKTTQTNGVSLQIPDTWIPDYRKDYFLQYLGPNKSFFTGIKEGKSHLPLNLSLNDYASLTQKHYAQDDIISNKKLTYINGLPAVTYNLDSIVNGVKLKYTIALIEGKDNFYQLAWWTNRSQFENQKDQFNKMLNSFQEIKLKN